MSIYIITYYRFSDTVISYYFEFNIGLDFMVEIFLIEFKNMTVQEPLRKTSTSKKSQNVLRFYCALVFQLMIIGHQYVNHLIDPFFIKNTKLLIEC